MFRFAVPGYLVAPVWLHLQASKLVGKSVRYGEHDSLQVDKVTIVRPLSAFFWNTVDVKLQCTVEGLHWAFVAGALLALGALGAGLTWGMLSSVERIIDTPAAQAATIGSTLLVVAGGALLLWVAFRSGLLTETAQAAKPVVRAGAARATSALERGG